MWKLVDVCINVWIDWDKDDKFGLTRTVPGVWSQAVALSSALSEQRPAAAPQLPCDGWTILYLHGVI